jgi:hypothetical protein
MTLDAMALSPKDLLVDGPSIGVESPSSAITFAHDLFMNLWRN